MRAARSGLTVLLAMTLWPASPGDGAGLQPRRARAVLILCDGLDAGRLFARLESPPYAAFGAGSAAGLVSVAVRGPSTMASAYLTLGAGDRVAARSSDQPLLPPGAPFESGTAAEAFRRRIGDPGPVAALHLGWAEVTRGSAAPGSRAQPGSLAGALERRGVRVRLALDAEDRPPLPAALAACDELGRLPSVGPAPGPSRVPDPLPPGLTVLALAGSGDDAEGRALDLALGLSRGLDPALDMLVLLAPTPGAAPGTPDRWTLDRLCPMLIWGNGWRGRVATSATTRTWGLVASIDVAPTLVSQLTGETGEPMGGREIFPAPGGAGRFARLAAYARQAQVARRSFVAGMVLWGAFAVLAGALGVGALLLRRRGLAVAGRAGLCMISTVPTAMLLVAWVRFSEPVALVGAVAATSAGLAILCWVLGRSSSPLLVAFAVGSAVVVGETLSGGERLPLALLAELPVQGFRFYGIGNEYEGVILGIALPLVPWMVSLQGAATFSRVGWLCFAAWSGLVVLVLAWPGLGADFGGGLAALVGALATARIARAGRLRGRDLLLFGAALLLAGAALFAVDLHRSPSEQSHIGVLARDLDIPRLVAVIRRKAAMNLRNMAAGPFAITVAVVAPVLWLWYHAAAGTTLETLRRRPLLASGLGGTLVAALTALLLNDSGIVPWGIATAAVLAVALDTLLAEQLARRPEADAA